MAGYGTFDPTLLYTEWFDPNYVPNGWGDWDLLGEVDASTYIAPIIVQSQANTTIPANASTPITFTSQKQGDCNLIFCGQDSLTAISSITSTNGNTYTLVGTITGAGGGSPGDNEVTVYVAANVNAGSETCDVTYSAGTNYQGVYGVAIRGAHLTNPVDTSAFAAGSSATASAGPKTTAYANELAIGYVFDDPDATGTPATGWSKTGLVATGFGDFIQYNAIPGSGTTVTVTTPLSGSGLWAQCLILIRPPRAVNPQVFESIGGPSDIITRTIANSRAIAESIVSPSDSVSIVTGGGGGTNYTGSISESISGPTDVVARAQTLVRAIPESVSISDSISRSFVGGRSIAESVSGATDSVTRGDGYHRVITESVTSPTDVVVRAFVGARAIVESVSGFTDAVARGIVNLRAITESIASPGDVVTRATGVARTVVESTSTPTDANARTFVGTRAIVESPGVFSDAVARKVVVARGIFESVVGATDSLVRALTLGRGIVEAISTPGDAVSGVVGGGGAFSGAIPELISTPTVTVTRATVVTRAIAESVAISDAVVRTANHLRNIAETITGPVDVASRSTATSRTPVESFGVPNDTVGRIASGFRAISESITAPSDTVAAARGKLRGIVESFSSPADILARGTTLYRLVVEAISTPFDIVTAVADILTPVYGAPVALTAPLQAALTLESFSDVPTPLSSPPAALMGISTPPWAAAALATPVGLVSIGTLPQSTTSTSCLPGAVVALQTTDSPISFTLAPN